MDDIKELQIDDTTYSGIEMGINSMERLWSPLFCLSETCNVEKRTMDSEVEEQGQWLVVDSDRLQTKDANSSWYERLRQVAYEVLVPIIQNICEDKGRASKKFVASTHTNAFLAAAYTPGIVSGRGSDKVLPEQFPLSVYSLKDWSKQLEQTQFYDHFDLKSFDNGTDISEQDPASPGYEEDVPDQDMEQALVASSEIEQRLIERVTETLSEVNSGCYSD